MKVVLEYDESSGAITDKNGNTVGTWLNLNSFTMEDDKAKTLIELKKVGYSAKDVRKLRNAGLL